MKTLALIAIALLTYGSLIYAILYAFLIEPRMDVKRRHKLKELPKGDIYVSPTGDLIWFEREEEA